MPGRANTTTCAHEAGWALAAVGSSAATPTRRAIDAPLRTIAAREIGRLQTGAHRARREALRQQRARFLDVGRSEVSVREHLVERRGQPSGVAGWDEES